MIVRKGLRGTHTNPPSPSMTHEWTCGELSLLGNVVDTHGFKWAFLTHQFFPGRSEDSVRDMYQRSFHKRQGAPREVAPVGGSSCPPYTEDENEELIRLVLEHDMCWSKITSALGRPPTASQALRKRWTRHVHKPDRSQMTTFLTSSREIGIVLRTLDYREDKTHKKAARRRRPA